MKSAMLKILNFAMLTAIPAIYGCGGGGGSGSASLLGGGSAGGSLSGGGAGIIDGGGGGGSIGTIHNPEPTTMLLLGSGLAAMAYYKSKRKSR